jgi:threonine/homoserine efflux transporter RhtA
MGHSPAPAHIEYRVPAARPIDRTEPSMNALQLVTLAAIWGASFLFMRMGAPDFGVVPLIALRVAIAAVLLSPVLRNAQARQELRSHALPLFIVGITNSALPFCLLTYAALFVSAGTDSILNATTPLWTAIVAYVWLRAPLTKPQAIGLALGFAGVVVPGRAARARGRLFLSKKRAVRFRHRPFRTTRRARRTLARYAASNPCGSMTNLRGAPPSNFL